MPYYLIRHITRYRYDAPIRENVTEVRMQPRSEANQRCLEFSLNVLPHAQVVAYQDFAGNTIHHFDIPAQHVELKITAEAFVQVTPPTALPESLPVDTWDELVGLSSSSEFWDYLNPSHFAKPTELLEEMLETFKVDLKTDPLSVLRQFSSYIYENFDYVPDSTSVDSPIDDAIAARSGVCQDFTHIMIALCRQIGIPCRYVSGYLYHREEELDRSSEDATHAWVEAYIPGIGWIAIDPTNNIFVTDRHIKVAVGRDYADVPPARGVFMGNAKESLSVGVRVSLADTPMDADDIILPDTPWTPPPLEPEKPPWGQQQQQQQ